MHLPVEQKYTGGEGDERNIESKSSANDKGCRQSVTGITHKNVCMSSKGARIDKQFVHSGSATVSPKGCARYWYVSGALIMVR